MDEIAHLISQKNDPEQVFELLDILGQGSYGSVSKALHKQTGQLYAIKILPATSGVEIASIKKQIGILKECNDDHIVKYYGSYFKDNNLWIVMEYCIAGSVADIMQITKKQFNEHQIASILQSVLKGLEYLHARKKIHRDIKAANILLDQKGNAKLADFGVSASSMHTNARFKTHIGSPYWMSPQIIKFSEYTYKTDIWSLGVTAIQLAQGQVPNSHIKPFMAVFMIKNNPVQSFKDPLLWSAQFNDFIKQCLQLNPQNRPEASVLLQHAFIKKYSKGQRLLSQLVLSSIQQIQQFRMNQSRNSSLAQIIIDNARQYAEEINTLVQGNSMINKQEEENLQSQQAAIQDEGSMIIRKSKHSISNSNSDSCAGSVIAYDNSMVEYRETDNSTKDMDPLTNYINGLRQQSNVQAKCMEKLVDALNRYDDQLLSELNRVFQNYKQKVEANIQGLQGLKKNNPSLKISSVYRCRIKQCENIKQFIHPEPKSKSDVKNSTLLINSRLKPEQQTQIKHNQSIQTKSKDQTNKKSTQQNREPIKSFLIPNNQIYTSQAPKFKKSYIQTQNSNSIDSNSSSGQQQAGLQKPPSNAHNSSRIMIKRTDQYNLATQSQVRQFVSDPEVLEYLRQKNYLNNQTSIVNHTKSSFQPIYTSTSINSRLFLRQQKSTQKSKSKSKSKPIKNIKTKKVKTKTAN